jgi:hypothetical protein
MRRGVAGSGIPPSEADRACAGRAAFLNHGRAAQVREPTNPFVPRFLPHTSSGKKFPSAKIQREPEGLGTRRMAHTAPTIRRGVTCSPRDATERRVHGSTSSPLPETRIKKAALTIQVHSTIHIPSSESNQKRPCEQSRFIRLCSRDDPGGDRGGAAGGVHGAGVPGAGATAQRRALPASDALPHAAEPPLRVAASAPAAAVARAPRHHPRLIVGAQAG